MKNRPLPNTGHIVTEWEDNIVFDADDPDFCGLPPQAVSGATAVAAAAAAGIMVAPPVLVGATVAAVSPESLSNLHLKVPATMSLASVHGPQFADICPIGRSSLSMSSSLSDLVGSPLEISAENVLTIEELRQQMGSCFTCGVSWTDDHVSLDCSECGGYSLERPCPLCDGQCGVQWKRDFTMSHACGKARWHGVCPSYPEALAPTAATTASTSCATAATQLRLAQELCLRLEQLSASAHT